MHCKARTCNDDVVSVGMLAHTHTHLPGVTFRVARLQRRRAGGIIQGQQRFHPRSAHRHLHAEVEEAGIALAQFASAMRRARINCMLVVRGHFSCWPRVVWASLFCASSGAVLFNIFGGGVVYATYRLSSWATTSLAVVSHWMPSVLYSMSMRRQAV